MQDLISVIIPVYQVEKYIEKCLLSLEKQTYKNLEIILIDDCSKDASGKICENRKEILKDKKIAKKDRISLHCTKFGFYFFKVSWKVYERIKKRKSK